MKLNQLVSLIVLAAVISGAGAGERELTPAESAGLCAGNSLALARIAYKQNDVKLAQAAISYQQRLYREFNQAPGFITAARYSYNASLTEQERVNVAINCLESSKEGA